MEAACRGSARAYQTEARGGNHQAQQAKHRRRHDGLFQIEVGLDRTAHDDREAQSRDRRQDRQDSGVDGYDKADAAQHLSEAEQLHVGIGPRGRPFELLSQLEAWRGELQEARGHHDEGNQARHDPDRKRHRDGTFLS